MTTKRAETLAAGDSILNPVDGQPVHVLHVDTSQYLQSDVDVQTTAGNYSANRDYPITVVN